MKLRTEKRKRKKTFFIQKGIFVATLALFSAFNTVAAQEKKEVVEDDTAIYINPEVLPEYPGGDNARIQLLIDNLIYPREARERGLEGKVIVDFVVEKDGRLTNFTIKESAHPILDAEALRVIKLMPNWLPGKEQGKVVRVYFQIPITFALGGDDDPIPPKGKKRKR